MCFNRTLEPGVAKVAQQDIYAFKILKKINGKFISPSRDTEWKVGEVKQEPNFERVADVNISIGLHSLKTLKDAREYMHWYWSSLSTVAVYQAMIPKGSLYWENKTQYCSEQMVIVSGQKYLRSGELSKSKK